MSASERLERLAECWSNIARDRRVVHGRSYHDIEQQTFAALDALDDVRNVLPKLIAVVKAAEPLSCHCGYIECRCGGKPLEDALADLDVKLAGSNT